MMMLRSEFEGGLLVAGWKQSSQYIMGELRQYIYCRWSAILKVAEMPAENIWWVDVEIGQMGCMRLAYGHWQPVPAVIVVRGMKEMFDIVLSPVSVP